MRNICAQQLCTISVHNSCAQYLCAISVHNICAQTTYPHILDSPLQPGIIPFLFWSSLWFHIFSRNILVQLFASTLLSLLLFKEKKKIQAESKSSQYFDTWQKMFYVWSYPLEYQRACTAETAPVQIRLPRLFSLKSILILRANDRLNQNQPSLSSQDHGQHWSSNSCCLSTFALSVNSCFVGQLVLCRLTYKCAVGQLVLCQSTCAPSANLCSVSQLVLCRSTCALLVNFCTIDQHLHHRSTCALLVNLCSVGQLLHLLPNCALLVNLWCCIGQVVDPHDCDLLPTP